MIRVDRKLNSTDVLDALTDLFILRGPPEYIRSDNGPLTLRARRYATHCPESAGPDCGGRGEDGLYRAGIALGERIL